ncbi:MAG: hypothetical protein WA869_20465, partial [Alloacidobacterium sp.]
TSSHNLAVSPALRWFGSAVTRNFAVEAAQAESSERKSAVGRLVHQALLPGWALAAAILLLLAVGWLIFRTLQPVIGDHFVLDPPNPGPNQSVTVTLQIQHASSVIITPPSDPTGVPGVYRIPQGFVTPDLKVSASNMFGTVDKTFHVNLAPSKRPDILAFTALPSQISKGDTITVSWKTQNADEVTIAPIGPVETSGSLTQTLDESTTFDLIAKNGGGQRTEQQQVKVDGNPAPPAQPQPTPRLSLPPASAQSGRRGGGRRDRRLGGRASFRRHLGANQSHRPSAYTHPANHAERGPGDDRRPGVCNYRKPGSLYKHSFVPGIDRQRHRGDPYADRPAARKRWPGDPHGSPRDESESSLRHRLRTIQFGNQQQDTATANADQSVPASPIIGLWAFSATAAYQCDEAGSESTDRSAEDRNQDGLARAD